MPLQKLPDQGGIPRQPPEEPSAHEGSICLAWMHPAVDEDDLLVGVTAPREGEDGDSQSHQTVGQSLANTMLALFQQGYFLQHVGVSIGG